MMEVGKPAQVRKLREKEMVKKDSRYKTKGKE
jgi:hypothetical protein